MFSLSKFVNLHFFQLLFSYLSKKRHIIRTHIHIYQNNLINTLISIHSHINTCLYAFYQIGEVMAHWVELDKWDEDGKSAMIVPAQPLDHSTWYNIIRYFIFFLGFCQISMIFFLVLFFLIYIYIFFP
jgi:hypothetical protein